MQLHFFDNNEKYRSNVFVAQEIGRGCCSEGLEGLELCNVLSKFC